MLPPGVVQAQLSVNIPKQAVHNDTVHSIVLKQCLSVLSDNCYVLILDIDALPLSANAIERVFDDAIRASLVGNVQRTNCIDNHEHLFVAPSFMCFRISTLREAFESHDVIRISDRSDVFEEFTYYLQAANREIVYYRPIHCRKPIWCLEGSIPSFGLATTFGIDNVGISYHHFCSRFFLQRLQFFVKTFRLYISLLLRPHL